MSRPNNDYSELKLLGSYEPRWLGGAALSGVYRWQNGQRWERLFTPNRPPFVLIRAEPRGTRRAPSVGTLDIRAEKRFPLHQQQSASLYLTVLNVTNVGQPLALVMQSGPSFGQPRTFTDPRMVWAGVKFTF